MRVVIVLYRVNKKLTEVIVWCGRRCENMRSSVTNMIWRKLWMLRRGRRGGGMGRKNDGIEEEHIDGRMCVKLDESKKK